jgi:hypothetical protein
VDTGVRLDPNAPACRDRTAPADGGFGATPVTTVTLCGRTLASRGDGRFNTPSVREAADTPPLFHNNSAATIEDAVRFYASATFNASPAAGNGTFPLSDAEVREVAAFLRAINALDNIASAGRSLEGAIGRPSLRNLLRDPAVRDINDAIMVLTRGPVRLFSGTRPELVLARANLNIARGRLTQAKADLASAAGLIGQRSP